MNRLIWKTLVFLSRLRTTIKYVAALPFTYRNWWAVPLVKVGRSAVLELRDGTRLLVRPGTTDLAAVNEAAIQNPYLGHSRIVLRDAATVIDIGAYIGDFTVQVARRCPGGRIVAVEPIREHVDMIATQLMLNRLSNVETVCAAMGAADGDGELSSAGIASRIGAAGASRRRVRVMTLETMMADYRIDRVDLLKLDCEGAEWDILPAAEGVLPRIDQICMEFHCERGWTAAKLADWLRARGFAVSHTKGPWNGLLWAARHALPDRKASRAPAPERPGGPTDGL